MLNYSWVRGVMLGVEGPVRVGTDDSLPNAQAVKVILTLHLKKLHFEIITLFIQQ